MAAYRRVYDSHHLQADCQEPGSAAEPCTLGNRVWATFTFFSLQNAPFHSQVIKIFFATGGKGALTPKG